MNSNGSFHTIPTNHCCVVLRKHLDFEALGVFFAPPPCFDLQVDRFELRIKVGMVLQVASMEANYFASSNVQ